MHSLLCSVPGRFCSESSWPSQIQNDQFLHLNSQEMSCQDSLDMYGAFICEIEKLDYGVKMIEDGVYELN